MTGTGEAAPSVGGGLATGLLGLAGVAALGLVVAGVALLPAGYVVAPDAPARALLVACGVALLIAVGLAPRRVNRPALLASGLAGLGALAAVSVAPDPILLAILLLLLAAGHSTLPGLRSFPSRMRGPGFSALLLGLGWLLTRSDGQPAAARLGALAFVLGLAAAAGLLPFAQELEPREPVPASSLTWTAFFGPALALVLPARVLPSLTPDTVPVYSAVMIGLGLLNLLWGVFGAWRATDEIAAWRYSFFADWGLVLVGLGLLVKDGEAAAYLVLLSVVLVRLPLYLWARPVLLGREPPHMGPINLLLAAALAGAAPFSGFSARLLELRAATQLGWPLAALLIAAMLLWLAHAFRLARSLGRPRGRTAIGVGLALAISLALGLAPGVFLRAGGL